MEIKNFIIFGKTGSGKDSVCKIIQQHFDNLNLPNEIIKIGGEIRKSVDDLVMLLKLNKNKKRELYVNYGQEMRKIFSQDIWNKILFNKVNGKDFIKIIGDGRQINEYDFWVNKHGYIPIGIITDDKIRKNRLINRDGYDQSKLFNNVPDNQVEVVLDNMQHYEDKGFIIYNNGNIEDLQMSVEKILQSN